MSVGTKLYCVSVACRILNFTPDLSYYETRRAIYQAFSVWSDVTRLQFHELQSGKADILIEFASGYHHDGYPFDGQGRSRIHRIVPLDFLCEILKVLLKVVNLRIFCLFGRLNTMRAVLEE